MTDGGGRWRNRITRTADAPTSSIVHNPANWRTHSALQMRAMEDAFDSVGWLLTVVVNERTGRLIDGHMRAALAAKKGEPTVPVTYVDLTDDEEALALATLDPIGEMAGRDTAKLRSLLDRVAPQPDGLNRLLKQLSPKGSATAEHPGDGGGAHEGPPVSKTGEVYELGRHILRCGDSTKLDEVAALLEAGKVKTVDATITDPPYAIYGSSTGVSGEASDDKMVRPFFSAVLARAQHATRVFGHVYIFCDWRSWPVWWECAKDTRLVPKNKIVWDKGNGGLGSQWANCYEEIGFFAHMPKQGTTRGDRPAGLIEVMKPNIQRFSRVLGEEREHNAAKPVPLLIELMDGGSRNGEVILDLFAGSGSTLIAAQAADRRCLTMEIEPRECDKVRRRWARYAKTASLDPGSGALE